MGREREDSLRPQGLESARAVRVQLLSENPWYCQRKNNGQSLYFRNDFASFHMGQRLGPFLGEMAWILQSCQSVLYLNTLFGTKGSWKAYVKKSKTRRRKMTFGYWFPSQVFLFCTKQVWSLVSRIFILIWCLFKLQVYFKSCWNSHIYELKVHERHHKAVTLQVGKLWTLSRGH